MEQQFGKPSRQANPFEVAEDTKVKSVNVLGNNLIHPLHRQKYS
jgi:hypothetical protein